MAQPIRFEQDEEGPEGAGTFEFDNGKQLYLHDPELAAKLASAPDRRLAENDVEDKRAIDVPLIAGSTADQELSDALASEAYQFGAGPKPSIRNEPPRTGEIKGPNAPAPAGSDAAKQQQAASNGGQMQTFDLGGKEPPKAEAAPEPPPRVYQAPRAGGYQPTTSQTVTESGAPYDPEMAQLRGDLNREVVRANLANFAAQAATAEQQAAAARAQIPNLMLEEAKAKHELQAKQDAYKQERAKAQVYVDAAYKRKIDPKALYREAGVAGSVAMVIGQALGAFGAAITHTDNFAQRLIDDALQRSFAAQEREIRDGQAGADNMLAQVSRDFGGDVEQAKAALDMSARKLLESQIQEQKAAATSQETIRAADIWLAQNQAAFQAAEQKFYDASLGKTTTTMAAKYQAPQAGGYREMSLEEQVKRKKALDYLQGRTDASGKPMDEGADPKMVERYAKRREGPENLIGQVDDVVGLAGGKIENGQVKFADDVPGIGPLASRAPSWMLSNRGQAIRQATMNLASTVVQDRSGAAASDKERGILIDMMEGGFKTEAELANGLNIIRRYAERKRRNIEASAPRKVRETYRQQGREAIGEEYEDSEDDVERY